MFLRSIKMLNPMSIQRELLEHYISYIDTGIPLLSEYYESERRNLLKKDSELMREPYIELVRKYGNTESGEKNIFTIDEACEAAEFPREKKQLIASFMRTCLLDGHDLYKHQKQSLVDFCSKNKNIVITTGTGSGKTESFLMPLLSNILTELSAYKDADQHRSNSG